MWQKNCRHILKGGFAFRTTGKTVLSVGYPWGDILPTEPHWPIRIDTCVWEAVLATKQDAILFIDEGNRFVFSKEFARAIQETDNYYVIVTREGLVNLPYSIEEIYGIREL